MSEGEQTGSLTCLWHGRYAYPRGLKPNAFTAMLREDGGWISGAIEELSQIGDDTGQIVGATVQGRRDAAQVRFLKTFDRPARLRDSVVYQGTLNHDATEITGRWTIPAPGRAIS